MECQSNVLFMNMNPQIKGNMLARRLLISRRDLNWNQDDLAEKSGVSRGYISNIERGHITNVGIEIIVALANALGVSPAYLIGLTEDPLSNVDEEQSADERSTLDTLTREFLSIFQQLGDDKRKTLLDLARMLRAADEPRIIGEDP